MEQCQPDPKTGIHSYCLPIREWKKGKILREFYPDIDSTAVQPIAKLMKNWGSGDHEENKLKLLEEETDYIAYDKNFKVIAAYFHSAYSRAVDEKTAAEIMVMAQENIKQVSEWQSKLLATDGSNRHKMHDMVGFISISSYVSQMSI